MINKLVIENLKHRRVRTLIGILFIGLEVAMMLTLVGVSRGTVNESARRARGVNADIWVKPSGSSVMSFSAASIPQKMVDYFQTLPHVVAATGSVVHPINPFTALSGVDLASYSKLSGGFKFVSGGPLQGPNDIMIDEYYARQNGKSVGDTINLLNRNWRVCGIIETGQLARLIVPMKELQDLDATGSKVSQVFLKLDKSSNTQSVINEIKARNLDVAVFGLEELLSQFSPEQVPFLKPFTRVVIGISIVVGFLITLLTMYNAVQERTREIGILKALGATPAYIMNILLRETMILTLLGIAVGIGLSFLAKAILFKLAPAALTQEIVPDWWLIGGVIALVGALLGAIYPGVKAARQDAIEALAYD